MNVTYRNHQNYVQPRTKWDDIRKKPTDYNLTAEDVKKVTVPGQSQTVKEILSRYEKGRPVPEE